MLLPLPLPLPLPRLLMFISQQLRGHYTKFKSKPVAQLSADVYRRSEQTAQVSSTDGKSETWSPSEISEEQAGVSGGRLLHAGLHIRRHN